MLFLGEGCERGIKRGGVYILQKKIGGGASIVPVGHRR